MVGAAVVVVSWATARANTKYIRKKLYEMTMVIQTHIYTLCLM